MMWWTGKGLWMGTLVALIVVSATSGGSTRGALGFLAAAVIVFVLRDWAGEESSLYSVPVRHWPPLLLLCAAFVYLVR